MIKSNNLPKWSFSSKIKELSMATTTSINGLKMDAKRGPLVRTHHDISVTIKPEATIPCDISNKIKNLING